MREKTISRYSPFNTFEAPPATPTRLRERLARHSTGMVRGRASLANITSSSHAKKLKEHRRNQEKRRCHKNKNEKKIESTVNSNLIRASCVDETINDETRGL
jgi:hypothetical protein